MSDYFGGGGFRFGGPAYGSFASASPLFGGASFPSFVDSSSRDSSFEDRSFWFKGSSFGGSASTRAFNARMLPTFQGGGSPVDPGPFRHISFPDPASATGVSAIPDTDFPPSSFPRFWGLFGRGSSNLFPSHDTKRDVNTAVNEYPFRHQLHSVSNGDDLLPRIPATDAPIPAPNKQDNQQVPSLAWAFQIDPFNPRFLLDVSLGGYGNLSGGLGYSLNPILKRSLNSDDDSHPKPIPIRRGNRFPFDDIHWEHWAEYQTSGQRFTASMSQNETSFSYLYPPVKLSGGAYWEDGDLARIKSTYVGVEAAESGISGHVYVRRTRPKHNHLLLERKLDCVACQMEDLRLHREALDLDGVGVKLRYPWNDRATSSVGVDFNLKTGQTTTQAKHQQRFQKFGSATFKGQHRTESSKAGGGGGAGWYFSAAWDWLTGV